MKDNLPEVYYWPEPEIAEDLIKDNGSVRATGLVDARIVTAQQEGDNYPISH